MVSSWVVSALGLVQSALPLGAMYITAELGFQAEYGEQPLEGFKQGCDMTLYVVEKFCSVENCLWRVNCWEGREAEAGEQVAGDGGNSDEQWPVLDCGSGDGGKQVDKRHTLETKLRMLLLVWT